jgi:hypothetical protein
MIMSGADKVRAKANAESGKIRRTAQRRELALVSKSDGKRNPRPPSGNHAPSGSGWMLDQCIAAYLSNDDAVESYLITKALVNKAKKGDVFAAQFLAERSQGKPKQKLDVGVSGQLSVALLDALIPEPETPNV